MPRWIDRLFTRPGPDAGRAVLLSLEPLDARDVPVLLSLNLPVSLPIDIPLVARVLATTATLGLVELSTGSAGLGLGVLPGVPTSPPVLPTPEVPTPEVPTPPTPRKSR